MSLIDRTATFRGNIVDHGVSLTKNEWPQWVAQLQAVEIWDAEEKVWVDFQGYEERDITVYLVLLGTKGEIFHADNLKDAVGWDGVAYEGLSNMDLSQVQIQFTVEPNTYENKTTMQVSRVAAYDAEPGRSVKKLDAGELKAIDAKYKRYRNPTKTATPAKATGKPKSPVTKPPAVKAKGIEPTQKKGPVTQKAKKGGPDPLGQPPETTQSTPPTMPTSPKQASATGSCTKKEAWDEVVSRTKEGREANPQKITDGQLGEAWTGAVGKFSNNPDDLTNEQWYQVKVDVLDKVIGIPF